jgi:hypothetical protein
LLQVIPIFLDTAQIYVAQSLPSELVDNIRQADGIGFFLGMLWINLDVNQFGHLQDFTFSRRWQSVVLTLDDFSIS